MNKVKKILIVEDEKLMAEMYEESFEKAGFEVLMAETAEEGFKKAKKEKLDLILLDILLPTENGVSCLTRLKKEPKTKEIPVVAFSNYDEPETKKRAMKLGAKAYLLKTDFTPQKLVEEIKKYLRKSNE